MKTIFILSLLSLSLNALAEGFEPLPTHRSQWDSANHPAIILKGDYETKFTQLKLNFELPEEKLPWSDSYWPRNKGGIAQRWQTREDSYKYKFLSKDEVLKASAHELSLLSPAEKFDLLRGDYKFSFTRKVRSENPRSAPGWQGICHGWSLAAIHHSGVKPITLNNPDNVPLNFVWSDVNALLSYYHANVSSAPVRMMGKRCSSTNPANAKCQDVNPAALFLVLANRLANEQKPFVVDGDPGREVWNFPVYGYESRVVDTRVPQATAAAGTVREVMLETNLKFTIEGQSGVEPQIAVLSLIVMRFWLELDKEDHIIGGAWSEDRWQQVDFVWISEREALKGDYKVFDTKEI